MQILEGTTALAMNVMSYTCNGLLATVYVQWFTCNSIFFSMAIAITSAHIEYHMRAHEIPRIMVKTV